MTALAALLSTLAVLAWHPPETWLVRQRLGLATWTPSLPGPGLSLVLAGLLAGPYLLSLPGPRIALVVTIGAAGAFVARSVRSSRARTQVLRRRQDVADLLVLMAAELRAGILPARILAGLTQDFPYLAPAARAADLGGDVPAALRSTAATPGRERLGDLAGAWHLADRAGAPLVDVLGRLESAMRADRDVEREVESGVAPARTTGRLMAVLPVVGLLLGSGMGGDPVALLTSTWIGVACLALGTGLACLGTAWVERIAGVVERDL